MDDPNKITWKEWKLAGLNLLISILGGVVAGIAAGIAAGVWVVKYQVTLSTAEIRPYWANPDPLTWVLTTENVSEASAQNLTEDLHFTEPIASHTQTPGAFSSDGGPVESTTLLSSRDHVTLKIDVLPPHAVYKISFVFRNPLVKQPDFDGRTSAGVVHVRQ